MNECRWNTWLPWLFAGYGRLVGRFPVPFMVLPLLLFGGLSGGLHRFGNDDIEEDDMEKLYFPKDSQSLSDRATVESIFDDFCGSYDKGSVTKVDDCQTIKVILVVLDQGNKDMSSKPVVEEIKGIVKLINDNGFTACERLPTDPNSTDVDDYNNTKGDYEFAEYGNFEEGNQICTVDGEEFLSDEFLGQLAAGKVTYPKFEIEGRLADLRDYFAMVDSKDGKMVSAKMLKLIFPLNSAGKEELEMFVAIASKESAKLTQVKMVFEVPESLPNELSKSLEGDISLFGVTLALIFIFSLLATMGGDCVSTRAPLTFAGVLSTGFGIAGAFGMMFLADQTFTKIVGVVPFLIIGVGVDTMFLLMAAYSESVPTDPDLQNRDYIPTLISNMYAKAGVGITISSLTDFLAFIIGSSSVFRNVTYFSLYAAVSILFCYLMNITFFGACLTVHARRVYARRHCLTYMVATPKDEMRAQGKSACAVHCCGGSVPPHPDWDKGIMERLPGLYLPRVVSYKYPLVCVVILVAFCGYLVAAIIGCTRLKEGLVLQDLVLESSYYHKFLVLNEKYYPDSIPIAFVMAHHMDYVKVGNPEMAKLLEQARKDEGVDDDFEHCWLLESSIYKDGSEIKIHIPEGFERDYKKDNTTGKIMACRCFVKSEHIGDMYRMAKLMQRMRALAQSSPLPVFAYSKSFNAYEQFLAIMPATLQMTGIALGAITVVTAILLPYPLMVFLVVVTILMILTGIFGFMHFWGLTLSPITMVHLVMGVGFSVDFSTHVCAAYQMSERQSRLERAEEAIHHAASPILNGALSTLIGVALLAVSSSFIFTSFFKVMFLVITFGLLHSVFFLPAVLSLIGPSNAPKVHVHAENPPPDNPPPNNPPPDDPPPDNQPPENPVHSPDAGVDPPITEAAKPETGDVLQDSSASTKAGTMDATSQSAAVKDGTADTSQKKLSSVEKQEEIENVTKSKSSVL